MKFVSRLALSALPLLPACLLAAPYNPAQVSADARWVIHADVEALRNSKVGQVIVAEIEKAQAEQKNNGIGLNIPRLVSTLTTLTAYGTNFEPDPAKLDGTLVAQGAPELRKIVESILLQGTLAQADVFSEVSDLPFPAYAISDPKLAPEKRTQVIIAFPPEALILVSKSKDSLQRALAVHRGALPALDKSKDSPLTRFTANATGAAVFAASAAPADIKFDEKSPQARVLQLTKAGSLALGEKEGMLVALTELSATSDRNADKLHKILEGLTAMLSLAESNDRQLAEFLNATKVTRDNDMVRLKVVYPTEQIVRMTQALANPPPPRKSQPASITVGAAVAEWTGAEAEPEKEGLAWRTIENVRLANGMLVTLGRTFERVPETVTPQFERVEIVPSGGGAPLVFGRDLMRTIRNSMLQFSFPGTEGSYTLKVAYKKGTAPNARFAVSTQDPRAEKKDGKKGS